MNSARFDAWLEKQDEFLDAITGTLPRPVPNMITQQLRLIFNEYFLRSLINSEAGSKTTKLSQLDKYIKNADALINSWNEIKSLLDLFSALSMMENNIYDFEQTKRLLEEYVQQSRHQAEVGRSALHGYFGDVKIGRPTDHPVAILIEKLTQILQELGIPIEFKSNTEKNRLGDTTYCKFMCVSFSVAGECPTLPFEKCEPTSTCSGLVKRIRKYIQDNPLI